MIKYEIIHDFDFIKNDKMIHLVYHPIIGPKATNIYNHFISMKEYHSQIGTNIKNDIIYLYDSLNIKQEEFEKELNVLEAIGLVETYKDLNKGDIIVFKLNEPLKWNAFVENKQLMALLKSKLGEIEFEKIKYSFQTNNKIIGLINTSKTFSQMFESNIDYAIDFDLIYNHLYQQTNKIVNLNHDTKVLLNNAYTKFNIQYADIINIINNSIIKQDKEIVVDNKLVTLEIKKYIDQKSVNKFNINLKVNRDKSIFLRDANLEDFKYVINDYKTLNSEQYLACIQKSSISDLDIKLIHELRTKYKLPDYIINVLIDYSIFINNGRIESQYLIKVAITINRLDLDSIDKILVHLQKAASNKQKIKEINNFNNSGVNW